METQIKRIRSKDLTADCWLVQMWGLEACSDCDARRTKNCRGKTILQKIKLGTFPKTGLPDCTLER